MLINIQNLQIKAKLNSDIIKLPNEIKNQIDLFWETTIKENPNLWNGEQICVTEFYKNNKEVILTCKTSNYAHYLYDERIVLPKEYVCSSLGAGCLLETSDGYYVVGELDKSTSYPYCMQVSGGSCDKHDIQNGNINLLHIIHREVLEELNIDLLDKSQVECNEIKYMTLPNERIHTYLIFSKGLLKMNKKEMDEHFKKYKKYLIENNGEIEFDKIHFIKKGNNIEEQLKKFNNPKREYLKQIMIEDCK